MQLQESRKILDQKWTYLCMPFLDTQFKATGWRNNVRFWDPQQKRVWCVKNLSMTRLCAVIQIYTSRENLKLSNMEDFSISSLAGHLFSTTKNKIASIYFRNDHRQKQYSLRADESCTYTLES